jgi:hypothetical protein
VANAIAGTGTDVQKKSDLILDAYRKALAAIP